MKKAPSKVQSNVMRAFAKKRRGYSQPAQVAPKDAPTSPTLLSSNYHAHHSRLPYEKQRDGSPMRNWETLSTAPIASVPTMDDLYMECDIKLPRKQARSVATPMSMAVSPKARSVGSPMAISPKLDLSFAGIVKRENKARASSAPAMERDIPATSSGLSLPIQNRREIQPPDKKCNYPNTLHSKVFGLHPTFGRSLELRRQWQAHVREQEGFMNSLFDGCKDFLIPGVKFRNLRQKMLLRAEKCKNEKDFVDRMSKNIRLLYSAFMALNKRDYSEVFIGDLQTNLRKIMAKVSVGLGKEYHLYDKIHENRNRAGGSVSLKRERSPIDAIMDSPANNKRFRK